MNRLVKEEKKVDDAISELDAKINSKFPVGSRVEIWDDSRPSRYGKAVVVCPSDRGRLLVKMDSNGKNKWRHYTTVWPFGGLSTDNVR